MDDMASKKEPPRAASSNNGQQPFPFGRFERLTKKLVSVPTRETADAKDREREKRRG